MDFKKYLANGLAAAKNARRNKEEIQCVIDELSGVVNDYSEGLVSLMITTEQRLGKTSGLGSLVGGAAAAGLGLSISPFSEYQALTLVLKKGKIVKKAKIAEWRMDESDGYPCIISYNENDISCGSKEMLERALSGLISSASTGERLLQLIAEGKQE
ncbi:TPA: hypothetical protein PFE28_001877 [Kluyvera cryocrescens]|nr:hypothetical protein [Kluyvera cryocrescens]